MATDAETAWCAGLYEGEGCVVYGAKHTGPLTLKIPSTDRDVLELLVERSGCGSITGPHKPSGIGVKVFYEWRVRGQAAHAFIQQIRPWLGERRRDRLDEKVALWQERPKRVIKVPPEARTAILRDRAAGDTLQVIADRHGVTPAYIGHICKGIR